MINQKIDFIPAALQPGYGSRWRVVWLFLLILALSPQTVPAGEDLAYTCSFEEPIFEPRNGRQAIHMPGLRSMGNPGQPVLPLRTVFILLPPGHDLTEVSVVTSPQTVLPNRFSLIWGQKQWPFGHPSPETFTPRDEAIYTSSEPFPAQNHQLIGVWSLCGYRIAVINLFPVEYIPASGTISYFPNMTLRLRTGLCSEILSQTSRMLRPSETLASYLAGMVENPESLLEYQDLTPAKRAEAGHLTPTEDSYPFLIITDLALAPSFQNLADFRTGRGLRTMLVTTQQISSSYPGADLPEQIRNFILQAYSAWQTDFVLLGGDDELVPHRGLYAQAFGYTDTDIPADLYYGALDGTWNDDGDNLWGEPGEEDLFPEVHVGRAAVDTPEEADHFIDKMIQYEESPVLDQTENALMVGEQLFDNPITWGGDYKDEIRFGAATHGFATAGFPANFTVNTLYDRDLGSSWWGGILLNMMNSGLHLINHVGHTRVDRALRLTADQVLNGLANNGIDHSRFIVYSQGCYAASFDNRNPGGTYLDDCVAEAFVTGEHGAVAFVGNSRYGWANPGTTDGTSQYFDRQFFDALFGEDIFSLGFMNDDSKIDNLWALDYQGTRWCYYQQNLLGDPAMDVWTQTPEGLTVTHPQVVILDEHNAFLVVVTSGSNRVDNAQVCIHGESGIYVTGKTNVVGMALFPLVPVIPETLDISVIAHNYLPYHGNCLARADGPSLWYSRHMIDDDKNGDSWGNGDGILNQGETIELTVWLQNFGDVAAREVTAVLTTDDPFVNITNPIMDFPDILPEEQQASLNSCVLTVSGDCPDLHQIELTVQAFMDEDSVGTSCCSLPVSAPNLVFENLVLCDNPPYGNGNGFLEADESALLMVTIRNAGSALANFVRGELAIEEDPYVQVDRDVAFFSPLNSGSAASCWPTFKVTASSESPPLHFLDYVLRLTASGEYTTQDTIPSVIGSTGLFDDMENPGTTWKPGDLWHLSERDAHSPYHSWYAGCDSSGSYPANVNASVTSQRVVLLSGSCLTFWHRYDLEDNEDFGQVEIYDGTDWTPLLPEPFTGASGGWRRESFDLSDRPSGSVIQIRFRLISDEQGSGEGWFVDDVRLGPPVRFWLDEPRVSPHRGTEETPFTYSAVYFSDRNYPPTLGTVFIDGAPHQMTSDDTDFTQGALFTYETELGLENHQYHFEFSSGLETIRWPRLGELFGPLVTETIYRADFEGNDGGYLVTGENWEWGVPTSGPQQAYSGEKVWATHLDGNYSSNADARLETPPIDLTFVTDPQLSFWHWFSFEYREANYDGGNVKVSTDGGEFQIVAPLNGYEGIIASNNAGIPNEPGFCSHEDGQFWHEEIFDLSAFSGHQIVIRFHLGSNGRYTYPGWYIDDVTITGREFIPQPVSVVHISAHIAGQDVLLNWSGPQDHQMPTEYIVYRGLFSNGELRDAEPVATVTDTFYRDPGAAGHPEVNYYYQIWAVDENGERMKYSEMVGEFDVPLRNSQTR